MKLAEEESLSIEAVAKPIKKPLPGTILDESNNNSRE